MYKLKLMGASTENSRTTCRKLHVISKYSVMPFHILTLPLLLIDGLRCLWEISWFTVDLVNGVHELWGWGWGFLKTFIWGNLRDFHAGSHMRTVCRAWQRHFYWCTCHHMRVPFVNFVSASQNLYAAPQTKSALVFTRVDTIGACSD